MDGRELVAVATDVVSLPNGCVRENAGGEGRPADVVGDGEDGRIVIRFHSDDELEGLIDRLTR